MKLIMLGTGNALVTECYNTCFVIEDKHQYFMVDGGGGNTLLHQLKQANIDWHEIKNIFVTHKHIDHLLGIIWMIRLITQNMSENKYEGEANIYAHEEVIDILKDISYKLLQPKETKYINDRLHFIVVEDHQSLNIINHKVTFFDIHSTKAKQFGFCMQLNNTDKLTCCGDEPYNKNNYEYVNNSKWLLHEAFCLYSERDIFKPYEKHHSTVKDACMLANELKIKNLILYHTEDKNIKNRQQLYKNEGINYYKGNLFIPNDFDEIEL